MGPDNKFPSIGGGGAFTKQGKEKLATHGGEGRGTIVGDAKEKQKMHNDGGGGPTTRDAKGKQILHRSPIGKGEDVVEGGSDSEFQEGDDVFPKLVNFLSLGKPPRLPSRLGNPMRVG